MSSEIDELRFSWDIDIGIEGIDDDPINPFARALKNLLDPKNGQPLKKLGLVFTQYPEQSTPPVRWLGTFVYSAGDRLLFFPGYNFKPDKFLAYQGPGLNHDRNLPIDHISLEKDQESWHCTSPKSKNHFGGPRTMDLGEGRVLWLGMSIGGPDVLRPVRKRTVIKAAVAASDATRRTEIFQKAREAVSYPLIQPNRTNGAPTGPYFYHYSFIVGPVGFPDYHGAEHGFPLGSPFLENGLPENAQIPSVTYRLSLAPYCDMLISMMIMPGKMTVPIAFTGPGGSQIHSFTEIPQ